MLLSLKPIHFLGLLILTKVPTSMGSKYIKYIWDLESSQRYIYRVLQTIQMKVMLLQVWAEGAVFGRAKTALKYKYEI